MNRREQRLRTIAERFGYCPRHATRLFCVLCDFRWVGSDAELMELCPLAARPGPYYDHIPPSGQCCRRCGHRPVWCQVCYDTAARAVAVPADLFTPAELTRYQELMKLFQPTSELD